MTVKIITDSSASIPADVVEELGITVVPSLVHFGDEVYRDGIDLTTEQFFERLTTDKNHPTTSMPTPQSFIDAYEKLADETDEVAVITVSQKLSAVGEVARQAMGFAQKRPSRVEIIDTGWALMSEGLIVITAARAAKEGASLKEVVEVARRNIPRTDLRMAFDTLKYLERGGRIGKAQASFISFCNSRLDFFSSLSFFIFFLAHKIILKQVIFYKFLLNVAFGV